MKRQSPKILKHITHIIINELANNFMTKKSLKQYSILLCSLMVSFGTLHSQEVKPDTLAFYKAQKKLDSCSSGFLDYKLNYITTNFELYWDIELYFLKNDKNQICFYIKQEEDSAVSEYVYYHDTLLIAANYQNTFTTSKTHTLTPFAGNIRRVFTYLLNKHDATNFLSYSQVNYYDSIAPPDIEVKVGEGFETRDANGMNSKYHTKIAINKTNNSLAYCNNTVEAYRDSVLFYSGSKEYLLDSIALFAETKVELENIIKSKYTELDSLIALNASERNKTVETNAPESDTAIVIPEYAFEWKLPLINGDTLSSNSLNSGFLVLDFYYMGCAPCVLAIGDLVKLDHLYSKKDVAFVGVNVYDKDLPKLADLINKREMQYPTVVNGMELSKKYGFNSFPQVLIIDTETNKIVHHSSGYRPDGYDYYKRIIDGLLNR